MSFRRRFRLLAPLVLAILAGCAATHPPKPFPSPPLAAPAHPDMAPIPNPPATPRPHPAAPVETPPPTNPLRAAELRGEGLEQLNRRAFAKAVALFKEASALDPGNPLIKNDLERALRALHDQKERR
jgi:hypothetical protein